MTALRGRQEFASSSTPGTGSRASLIERVQRLNRESPSRRDSTNAARRELLLAAKAGDDDARLELTQACLPLIARVARIYRHSPVERTDLVQAGVVGLLRALERYDPALGTPFWAYACWWVRQAMQHLVSELCRPIVLSDRALRHLMQVRRAEHEHLQLHHKQPTCQELATTTGLSTAQVEDLVAAARLPRVLDDPTGRFTDRVVDPAAEDAFDRVLGRLGLEDVRELLSPLSERERQILRGRYGIDGPEQTLHALANRLGLSAERVRQIQEEALSKLRREIGAGPE